MNCVITSEQQRKFRRIISHDLSKMIDAGEVLNLRDYMKSMYDSIFEATEDHARALSYARLIPEMMVQLAAFERKTFGKYLKQDLADIMDQAEMFDDTEKGLDNVADYIGVAPVENNDFEENANAVKKRKEKEGEPDLSIDNTPIEPDTSGNFLQNIAQKITNFFSELWRAWAPTALSDWAYETHKDTNNPITKGNTQLMFKIKRNLLKHMQQAGDVNSSEINYDDWGAMYLTAMSVSQIEEELGEEVDLSRDSDRNGIFLVITRRDNQGRTSMMRFNEEGNPDYNGTIGYYRLRKVEDHINDKGEYSPSETIKKEDEQRVNAIAKIKGITKEAAWTKYIAELNALHKIREYVLKDKENNTVELVINGGSLGVIRQSISNPNFRKPLSASPQEMRFKQADLNDANAGLGMMEGVTYFFVDEMLGQPLQVERPFVDAEFNGVDMLSNLLIENIVDELGNPLSLTKRIQLAKQYIKLGSRADAADIDIKYPAEGQDNHRVKIGSKTYNLNTPQEKQIAREVLRKAFTDLRPQSKLTQSQVDKRGKNRKIVENIEDGSVNDILKTPTGYYALGKAKLHVPKELTNVDQAEIELVNLEDRGDGTFALSTSKQKYSEFLKENFYGSAEVSADGRYRKAGAYFTFSLTKSAEKELYPEETKNRETTIDRNRKDAEEIEAAPIQSSGDVTGNPMDIINKRLKQDIQDAQDKADEAENNEDREEYLKIKRVKQAELKATEKQIEEARKWYENHPMQQYIPFEAMFHLVNSENPNAVATWSLAGIILFQGSDYSDLYHEAWHGFSQAFMTPEQRADLYLEVSNKEGTFTNYKGQTVYFYDSKYRTLAKKKNRTAAEQEYVEEKELQYEEWLAEEFRNYMLNGQKPLKDSPKTNGLFKRIWNFLKTLFSDSTAYGVMLNEKSDKNIREIFEKLKTGNIKEYSFSRENANFNELNFGITALENREGINELNYQDSVEVLETIDSLIAEFVKILNTGLTIEEQQQYAEIQSRINSGYYKRLSNEERNQVMEQDKALKERLEQKATYKYTSLIVKDKALRLDAYNYALARLKIIRDDMAKDLAAETDTIKKNELHKDIRKLDFAINEFGVTEQNADGDTILAELDTNAPKEGKSPKGVIGYHMTKSAVFQDQMVKLDFEDMSETEANLKGRSSVDSDRRGNGYSLKELAKAEIVYLITGLSQYDKNGNVELNRFHVPKLANFQATWNRLARLLTGTNSIDKMYQKLKAEEEVNPQIKELLSKLGPIKSDNSNLNALWTNLWQAFGAKTRIPLIQLTITKAYDKRSDTVTQIYTAGEAFRSDKQVGKNWQSVFDKTEAGESKYILKDKTGSYLNLDAILEDFPIGPNVPAAKALTNRQFEFFRAIGFNLTDTKEIRDELNANPGKYMASYFRQKILAFKNEDAKVRTLEQLTEDENAPYKALQQLEARYSDVFSNFMAVNAEGNTQFEHSLSNSMSQVINTINDAKTYDELISQRHTAHLNIEDNPFSEASNWMKSLFDLTGTPETNANYGNRKRNPVTGDFVSLKLTNLSGAFLTNESNEGDGVASAKADEYTKFIMDLHLSYAGFPELMRHADKGTSYSVSIDGAIYGGVTNQYVPAYLFAAEPSAYMSKTYDHLIPHIVAEMRRMRIIRDMQGTEVYDHKYLEFGKYFTTFDDVFIDETITELTKIVENQELDVTKSGKAFQDAIDGSVAIRKLIQNDLQNYFNKQFDKAWARFQDAGFTATNLISDIKSKGKKAGVPINELSKAQEALVRSMVHNQWIHNIESISLLYGDLALFNHAKEEFHKRNAGMGSTGTLYRTDSIMQSFINSTIFETSYTKASLERLGMTMEDVKQYDGTFHTAILKDQNIGSVYYNDYIDYLVSEGVSREEAKTIMKPYAEGEMTEGDAQGLITFDAYRELKIAEGEWSDEHQDLFERVIKAEKDGRTINPRTIQKFFPVIKAQYWGPLMIKGLPLTAFHKYSLMPLIPTVIKNKNIKRLHDKMIRENISYVTFESGSKVSTITKKDGADVLYSENRTLALEDKFDENGNYIPYFTKNTIHLEYLKNQLAVHDEYKGSSIFSTQLRKLVEDGLMEEGVPIDYKPNLSLEERVELWKEARKNKRNWTKNYKLVKKYEGLISQLTEFQKDKLLKEMNWTRGMLDGTETKDMKALMEFVYNQLSREDLAEHELNFIQIRNGNIKWDLSLSFSADKIEKILNALLVNRLIKQKVNGEGLIQVASTLFEDMNGAEGYNWTNATEADNKKYNGSNDLPTYYRGEDGVTRAMKVKVALQGDFMNLLDLTHTDGERIRNLERLNEVIKDDAWLDMEGKRHREMITMVGVRIPVQGLNSMEFMEVYEFLPAEAGSIIIPPSEIVAKSGADFDVDKLTIMMPNIRRAKRQNGQITTGPQMWNYNEQELKDAYDYYIDKKAQGEGFVKEDLADAIFAELGLWDYNDGFTPEAMRNELVEMLIEEGKAVDFKEFKKRMLNDKAIQNDLLATLKEIMSLPENYRSLITPNSTRIFTEGIGNEKALAEDLKSDVLDFDPLDVIHRERRKGAKGQDIISPTRILEVEYNLYKHTSNAVGKATLGLGAVDNTYNSLFNRIGFHLNPTIGVSTAEYNNLVERKNQGEELDKADLKKIKEYKRQTLYLNHNTQIVNGEEAISLSQLKDSERNHYISDVINQLMNGWVDIARDTWIFNVQGNKELSPALLFMVQAGVPVKEAVYMLSMPLVREYLKHQKKFKSAFNSSIGYDIQNKQWFASEAIRKIINNQENGFDISPEEIAGEKFRAGLTKLENKFLMPFIEQNGKFDPTKMRAAIKNQGNARKAGETYSVTELDRAAFLHFIQIQDMARAVRDVKMKMNVDTSKDGSLFEAQNRLMFKEKLRADKRFPAEMIDMLEKESPISSFFIQDFQIDVLGDAFPLRNNKFVNEEIMRIVKDRDLSKEFIDTAFSGDAEAFAKAYKADLPLYLFQNAIRGVDPANLTSYKGYKVKKATVKKVQSLRYGAHVQDGVLYVDVNEMNRQFVTKAFKSGSDLNKKTGLASLTNDTFNRPEEYYKFVIERALLRDAYSINAIQNDFEFQNILKRTEATYKKAEGESQKDFEFRKLQATYEQWLRNKALDNSFNHHKMFKSKDTYAQQYFRLLDKHDDLAAHFSIINSLTIQTHNSGYKNLSLNDAELTGDQINIFHENLATLSNVDKLSEVLPYKTKQELTEISDFFSRFPIVSFLQSGFNTTGRYSMVRLVDYKGIYSVISSEVAKLMKHLSQKEAYEKKKGAKKSRSKVLADYLKRFGDVTTKANRPSHIRGKDYFTGIEMSRNTSEPNSNVTVERGLDPDNLDLSYPLTLEGVVAKGYDPNQSDLVEMAEQNPDLLFVYNAAHFDQRTGGAPQADARLGFANVTALGLPTKAMYKNLTLQEGVTPEYLEKSSIIRDKNGTIDPDIKQAIDAMIDELIDQKGQGKVLVFNKQGYGQDMLSFKKDSTERFALETFLYLSKRLLEVGFINPNYLRTETGRQETQTYQEVSDINIKEANDEAVRDYMNHCMNI